MRRYASVLLAGSLALIGCGESPHVVSTPPPPPAGLRMPPDAPTHTSTVAQTPPPVVSPVIDNGNPTNTGDSFNNHDTSGTSGRTGSSGTIIRPPPVATTCTDPKPGPGYVCMQACGEPVERDGDPPPPMVWLSPAQAENRRKYRCPICLPDDARIATPQGNVRVIDMRPGMPVFTADENGHRMTASVERIGSALVPATHELVQIELSDGRTFRASPGHPTADGRSLGSLRIGDRLDNATIQQAKRVPYNMPRTYDILPSGKTGTYWVNGVLVGSTLQADK